MNHFLIIYLVISGILLVAWIFAWFYNENNRTIQQEDAFKGLVWTVLWPLFLTIIFVYSVVGMLLDALRYVWSLIKKKRLN